MQGGIRGYGLGLPGGIGVLGCRVELGFRVAGWD